ncbi:alkaline phosphatase family protein [Stieleria varia]|uniref:Type I phosphodiesterase / nucleotide pyrophosphatase n=1 Tax=Stieleria varia TaxID=2528005 RepID=A0A5C6BB37_9BACT|nr:alkaline phosphatase family protein [Stieleria varia]TWU08476.1 Type I phosphodiesterase / nucleotide pyrophosphatase [Stieleria varia]
MRFFCHLTFIASVVCLGAVSGFCEQTPERRVLVIGIDGCRRDALQAAKTPALDSLVADGAMSESTQILGKRYRFNNTVSGPGWSSFLTGVWADKHGVHDNSFKGKNYVDFPHFFARIKQRFPAARTVSLVDWEPIDTHIVSHADVHKVYPAEGADGYTEQDAVIARDAAEILASDDPHAMMVYFGAVDETGHRDGFHPSVASYLSAIETVDSNVQKVLAALRSRPNYKSEHWLVLVSTDHGGRGTSHGGGHDLPEINTTFLIVSGSDAAKGPIESPTELVDLPMTALVHLGVTIDPNWKLDGKPVGLR